MPPATTELEVMPILRKESEEGKGGGKRKVVDGLALDEEVKAYLLARDVVKGVPANLNWEPLDVLDYIGLGQYLGVERFSILYSQ